MWLELCSDLGVVLCVGFDPRTEERIEWQPGGLSAGHAGAKGLVRCQVPSTSHEGAGDGRERAGGDPLHPVQ